MLKAGGTGFTFTPLDLPGLIEIEHGRAGDERGFFSEYYRQDLFEAAGVSGPFVQWSLSRSEGGTLRGLHYQLSPQSQGKLVRCARGEIFDVAVDLRRSSPHFGRWIGRTLSEANRRILYIPPGFAHGFCVLSAGADVDYRQSRYYAPELERGIRWDDAAIGIAWPVTAPRLAPRDMAFPALAAAEINYP